MEGMVGVRGDDGVGHFESQDDQGTPTRLTTSCYRHEDNSERETTISGQLRCYPGALRRRYRPFA
jgi:hypothetical protein